MSGCDFVEHHAQHVDQNHLGLVCAPSVERSQLLPGRPGGCDVERIEMLFLGVLVRCLQLRAEQRIEVGSEEIVAVLLAARELEREGSMDGCGSADGRRRLVK